MITLFDQSIRMSEAESVIGQAPGDGYPVHMIISELKKFTDPLDEKMAASDSPSSRKSNATSLKMLLAKEMAKEVESKRSSPSVIARLMGLEDDLSAEEPTVHHARSDLNIDSKAINKVIQAKGHHQSTRLMTPDDHQLREYNNDVYELCVEQSRRYFQDQISEKGWSSENKSEQSDILQEKFMEPKCFSLEEKPLYTKDWKLHEAVDASCSSKDLFHELHEAPISTLSRQLSGFHKNQAPPQTKRITVLKPIRSVETDGLRQSGKEQVDRQNGLKMRKFHQGPHSKEEITSQPSRIVVLRPTPGKPGISKAKLTPRATSFRLSNRRSLDDNGATIGSSSGLVDDIRQHWNNGFHQRDDSLLSSAYSNGYRGDESSLSDSEDCHSSGSEIDYIEEDGHLSDSERGSPLSKHSWKHIRRYENLSSGASVSKISHFPEASVIREGKKQLSERWAMVTCDMTSQGQIQPSRRTCTLGEMLSMQEGKKEDSSTGILSVSSNRSCDMEDEPTTRYTYITTSRRNDESGDISPRKLPRSNSLAVISSTFDNMVGNVEASNPVSCKPKVSVVPDKGKSSFKGILSDFLLSRSKRPRRLKNIYDASNCFTERVEACIVQREQDCSIKLDANEKAVHNEGKFDCVATQTSASTSARTASIGAPISPNCPSVRLDKIGVNTGLNSNRDQPSPTSVLDAPSEDSSCNEPEASGRTTSKNARLPRSSAVEAVACSLSWDDTASESQLLCTPRQPSVISNTDDDESECHVLMQNIMSSAGLGTAPSSMVFTGWHLPDYPLDPVLCNKILELQQQSSYRRLLFDCVNAALIEIGENALLSAFPCSKALSRTRRDTSAPDLRAEVWSILKDWIHGERLFVVSRRDNTGVILDRTVKQEIEGRGWLKLLVLQVADIAEQLEGGVMEELLEETVLDFTTCF